MNGHRCGPRDCTFTATFVACGVCHQRWWWHPERGWQPNPRIAPGRYQR